MTLATLLAASAAAFAILAEPPAAPTPVPAAPLREKNPDPAYVMGHSANLIDGTPQPLEAYKGRVVVIVNVASKCGYTSQYAGLEKLYREKKDQGLVILGFPANNFMGQEPGSNADIATFCKDTYGVSFPMFEKVSVKGSDQHPLFKQLASQPEPIGGAPKWNFTKFVVDRQGRVVARFDAERKNARTGNLEEGLLKRVDELLAAK